MQNRYGLYGKISLLILFFLGLIACEQAPNQLGETAVELPATEPSTGVPRPDTMQVDIVISGRVSTLKSIDVVHVGKQIPYTYSDGKISNTPGFEWWVSKHFALKSDLPEQDIKLYLEFLEMSYPHYIELFGAEPPNIENQRIAVVYASSRDELKVSMIDDGFRRGVHDTAGGETMYWNRAGYNFPSSRLHHRRYIVIHETAHAFQMALMQFPGYLPGWFIEGTADAFAHHVYDSTKKQLNFMVFDRGPMDYVRTGLKQYAQLKQPSIEDMMTKEGSSTRGINFLMIHFLMNNPDYSHSFKIYRDEMVRLKLVGNAKKSFEILRSAFDDWPQVEKAFAAYVANAKKVVNLYYDAGFGPWEQDGNAFWIRPYSYFRDHQMLDGDVSWTYAYNQDIGTPRIDFDLPLSERPRYQAFKMDYPVADKSTLLGVVARGVEMPSVGAEIAYLKDHLHRGMAGIALAIHIPKISMDAMQLDKHKKNLEKSKYNNDLDENVRVFVENARSLVIDQTYIGGDRQAFALPENIRNALQLQGEPKLGLTVTIRHDALEAEVITDEKQLLSFKASVPIDAGLREKLLNRSLGLILKEASHRITPYFDDGRVLNPYPRDLMFDAPVNAFANPADKAITRLSTAIWRLREHAPSNAKLLRTEMVNATMGGPRAQMDSLKQFQQRSSEVAASMASCAAEPHKIDQALAALSGTSLRIEWDKQAADGRYPLAVVLRNTSDSALSGNLRLLSTDNQGNDAVIETQAVNIAAGGMHRIIYHAPKPNEEDKTLWSAVAELQWQGQSFKVSDASKYPYDWASMAIIEPAHIENGEIKITALLRGPLAGETEGKLIMEVQPASLVEQGLLEEAVSIKPYAREKYVRSFKLKPGPLPKRFAVLVRFDVEVDGEAIRLERLSSVE